MTHRGCDPAALLPLGAPHVNVRRVRLPAWLTLTCAAMVILWGAYRIKLGLRTASAEAKAAEKKGLFGLPRRTHLLIGVIYLLLGAGLIAVTFGWNPLAMNERPAQPRGDGAIEVEPARTR
jgi:hypothetical protein